MMRVISFGRVWRDQALSEYILYYAYGSNLSLEHCGNDEIYFALDCQKTFDAATFEKALERALDEKRTWKKTVKVSLSKGGFLK